MPKRCEQRPPKGPRLNEEISAAHLGKMRASKVVGRRKAPQTPAEFHTLGARLDRELSVVKPFT